MKTMNSITVLALFCSFSAFGQQYVNLTDLTDADQLRNAGTHAKCGCLNSVGESVIISETISTSSCDRLVGLRSPIKGSNAIDATETTGYAELLTCGALDLPANFKMTKINHGVVAAPVIQDLEKRVLQLENAPTPSPEVIYQQPVPLHPNSQRRVHVDHEPSGH